MLESFKSGEKIININETWITLNELRCKNSKLGANEKLSQKGLKLRVNMIAALENGG
jgi:hypothetical protein